MIEENKLVYQRVLAPHNYKKGELILGRYRYIDMALIIISVSLFVFVLLISMFVIKFDLWFFGIFGILVPVIIFGLVQPLPNYHNYLEYLIIWVKYLKEPKLFSSLIEQKEKVKTKKVKTKKK